MDFHFVNSARVSTRKKTPEGYLDLTATIYRSGLFEFTPGEFAEGDIPTNLRNREKIVLNVPDSAIRDQSFLESAAAQPVTDGHPGAFVNSGTASQVTLGTSRGVARAVSGGEVLNADADLRIYDAAMVAQVESKKVQEVSIGNGGVINWSPGKRRGVNYDGVLTDILVNHIAIVDRGRGGESVRLHNKKSSGGESMDKITKIINGVSATFAKEDEFLVDSLATEIQNTKTQLTEAEASLAKVSAELENAKTKNTDLEKQVSEGAVTPEEITKLVNARAAVIENARKLTKDVDASKSSQEIMIAAIQTVNADLVPKDATEEVVTAVFNTLAKVDRVGIPAVPSESQSAAGVVSAILGNAHPSSDDALAKVRKERSERRKKLFNSMAFGR